jgi:DNA-binding protein HU-beta
MKKQELISAIASAANLSTVEAACALDATTDAITHALAQGSDVRLINLVDLIDIIDIIDIIA